MYRNLPIKAIANGEPTYEHGGKAGRATGWWQGYEAWSNILAGGIMGTVYGAGSLWQWAHRGDEAGQSDIFLAPGCGWREALNFEGSTYVGLINRILGNLDLTDAEVASHLTLGARAIHVPGKIVLAFQDVGGKFNPAHPDIPAFYTIIDPRSGVITHQGELTANRDEIGDIQEGPRIYLFTAKKFAFTLMQTK
jgi:hypothetical protein